MAKHVKYITDPVFKEEVKKYMPGFDFTKPLTFRQVQSVIRIVAERKKEEYIKIRYTMILGKNLVPGCKVVEEDTGETAVIRAITNNGFLQLVDKKGSFSPKYWRKA